MQLAAGVGVGGLGLVGAYLYRRWAAGGQCKTRTDMRNRVAIITGSNTGIGFENAKELASMGAHVFMACRNPTLGQEAAEKIQKELAKMKEVESESKFRGKVEFLRLDLASLKSVREFVEEFEKKDLPLHILVNNAGVMMCPLLFTEDGFEMQLGTNHFGHFLLTGLLLPKLKQSAPSRIVILSSLASERSNAEIDFEHLKPTPEQYSSIKAYRQSKLANVLFCQHLAHNYLEGTGVTCYSLHPGVVNTELGRHLPSGLQIMSKIGFQYLFPMKTAYEGAQTNIYLCVEPGIENLSGSYFADCALKRNANPATLGPEIAEKLWSVSEEMVGFEFSKS